jgi:hypothetical protein
MKVTPETLLQKLDEIDHALLELWVEDESEVGDEEKWEIFVKLLEARVELVKTCIDAKMELTKAQCFPQWLERLTHSRKELRLREIKILYDDLKRQKQISKYRKVGRTLENDPL